MNFFCMEWPLARTCVYVPDAASDARRRIVRYAAAVGHACEAHARKGRTRCDVNDPTAFKARSISHWSRQYDRVGVVNAGPRGLYFPARVSLRPSPLAGFNPDAHTSTPFDSASDAFERLHPDVALNDGPSTLRWMLARNSARFSARKRRRA
jgi:hypothetical protein